MDSMRVDERNPDLPAVGDLEGPSEQDVDDVLAESFPASDPPPWTPAAAAVDVVIPQDRRGLGKVVEAIVLVALLPLAVIVVAALIRAGGAAIRLVTR